MPQESEARRFVPAWNLRVGGPVQTISAVAIVVYYAPPALFAWLIVVASAALALRWTQVGIELTEDAVVVRNTFGSRKVPWRDVSGFASLDTAFGRVVAVKIRGSGVLIRTAVGELELFGDGHGPRSAAAVADRLNRVMRHHQ